MDLAESCEKVASFFDVKTCSVDAYRFPGDMLPSDTVTMDGRRYASIEDEESETNVRYDGENVNLRVGDIETDKISRKPMNLNLDLLKFTFGNAVVDATDEGNNSNFHVAPQISLSFSNLSYSVKQGLRRGSKTILNNLHGEFLSGELSAIMGPSGSGKSTLMNVLAGFTTSGVGGIIKTNGVERDLRIFARQSCYIMQDDELCPLLTVQEALTLAAHLKLGPKVKGKSEKVKKLLKSLGLYSCRKVMSGKLSGGQKKRLAIALELISNPPVLFFDEPTSGLDSSTSKQCISVLKELAKSGRTVVCTIHQPSASLFEMFDYIYAVRNGRCLYSGGTKGLVPFLGEHGLHCPRFHNPADYILEIASMNEYSANLEKLTTSIDDGKCTHWRKTRIFPNDGTTKESVAPDFGEESEKRLNGKETEDGVRGGEFNTEAAKRWTIPRGTYPTSFWKQFSVLMIRNFKKIYRDMLFTYLQLLLHVLFGLLIGTLFYNIGNDAAFVPDNYSLIFFCVMLNMFTSYSAAMSQYPQELPILAREHFNKWYSLKAHFIATNFSGLPVQVSCSLLYTSIVYFMTAQPPEVDRYLKTISIVLLIAFVGQSFGYLISSTLSVQNASIFGALITAPFMLFSGYFVHIPDSPPYLKWLFHISYFKYALEGLMIAIFGDQRPKMKCSEDYCHFITPSKFLRQVGMEFSDYWFCFGVLLVIGLFLRIATYYFLSFRIKYFKNYCHLLLL